MGNDEILMMAEVLSGTAVHLDAAEGYKHTGATVALDGFEDHLIVREAGRHWADLNMRARINTAVAQVKEELRAGRLAWAR